MTINNKDDKFDDFLKEEDNSRPPIETSTLSNYSTKSWIEEVKSWFFHKRVSFLKKKITMVCRRHSRVKESSKDGRLAKNLFNYFKGKDVWQFSESLTLKKITDKDDELRFFSEKQIDLVERDCSTRRGSLNNFLDHLTKNLSTAKKSHLFFNFPNENDPFDILDFMLFDFLHARDQKGLENAFVSVKKSYFQDSVIERNYSIEFILKEAYRNESVREDVHILLEIYLSYVFELCTDVTREFFRDMYHFRTDLSQVSLVETPFIGDSVLECFVHTEKKRHMPASLLNQLHSVRISDLYVNKPSNKTLDELLTNGFKEIGAETYFCASETLHDEADIYSMYAYLGKTLPFDFYEFCDLRKEDGSPRKEFICGFDLSDILIGTYLQASLHAINQIIVDLDKICTHGKDVKYISYAQYIGSITKKMKGTEDFEETDYSIVDNYQLELVAYFSLYMLYFVVNSMETRGFFLKSNRSYPNKIG